MLNRVKILYKGEEGQVNLFKNIITICCAKRHNFDSGLSGLG